MRERAKQLPPLHGRETEGSRRDLAEVGIRKDVEIGAEAELVFVFHPGEVILSMPGILGCESLGSSAELAHLIGAEQVYDKSRARVVLLNCYRRELLIENVLSYLVREAKRLHVETF